MSEHKFYLTVAREKRQPQNDGYIAIISLGSPQRDDENITVLSTKLVKNMKEASAWFKHQCHEKPWETRQ